ncbi:AtzE family amidohydrolase [Bradyrhizobium sp. CNPSo 4026]|nr:AtzE family amidohydrolase [Bradyrhizobium cenepequi]
MNSRCPTRPSPPVSTPPDNAMTDQSLSAAEIAQAVATRKLSALEATEAALARIATHNSVLNAFTDVTADRARARAKAVDAAIAAGQDVGPLAGVPFAVKNLFDVQGISTRAGSKINRDLPPAARDATLIERMEAAGAVLVGALNMGEYAYDFTGENVHDGPSRNPHDPTRMTGGSSGGSGSAVGGGLVPIALGSDTNGSIRVPSSFCGIFGLKPTYGRLSRARSFPFVASFDHLGPLARSARDLALAYDAMQGPDPDDAACTTRPVEPVMPQLAQGLGDLRIAIAGGYFQQNVFPEAVEAVARIAKALNATRTLELPEAARARAAAYVITTTEGASLHLDRLRKRPNDFDPAVRDRLIAGAMIPAPYVDKAQKFRRWYREKVLELFKTVDVILAPATPCVAPKLGQVNFTLDGVELPVRANIGIHTQPISFIGLPVVAVPVPLEPMPIGVQIITAPWREDIALRVAYALEHMGAAAPPLPRGI